MLTKDHIVKIKTEIEQAATAHLNAQDVDTALNHYADEVFAVSNTKIFPTRESLFADIREYYKILKEVNYASWKEVHIHVIGESAATFTAQFSYGFTSTDGTITDLEGVWTALFIRIGKTWKIRLRHESFQPIS
jgi:ketosteroid isomerase-like protein